MAPLGVTWSSSKGKIPKTMVKENRGKRKGSDDPESTGIGWWGNVNRVRGHGGKNLQEQARHQYPKKRMRVIQLCLGIVYDCCEDSEGEKLGKVEAKNLHSWGDAQKRVHSFSNIPQRWMEPARTVCRCYFTAILSISKRRRYAKQKKLSEIQLIK